MKHLILFLLIAVSWSVDAQFITPDGMPSDLTLEKAKQYIGRRVYVSSYSINEEYPIFYCDTKTPLILELKHGGWSTRKINTYIYKPEFASKINKWSRSSSDWSRSIIYNSSDAFNKYYKLIDVLKIPSKEYKKHGGKDFPTLRNKFAWRTYNSYGIYAVLQREDNNDIVYTEFITELIPAEIVDEAKSLIGDTIYTIHNEFADVNSYDKILEYRPRTHTITKVDVVSIDNNGDNPKLGIHLFADKMLLNFHSDRGVRHAFKDDHDKAYNKRKEILWERDKPRREEEARRLAEHEAKLSKIRDERSSLINKLSASYLDSIFVQFKTPWNGDSYNSEITDRLKCISIRFNDKGSELATNDYYIELDLKSTITDSVLSIRYYDYKKSLDYEKLEVNVEHLMRGEVNRGFNYTLLSMFNRKRTEIIKGHKEYESNQKAKAKAKYDKLVATYGKTDADRIRKGKIEIGMSEKIFKAVCDYNNHSVTLRRENSNGKIFEITSFFLGRLGFVTVRNGKVYQIDQ
jgi:hypothetical protein